MKRALDEQLQARPRPDPNIWGEDPLRVKIGLLVCKRMQEEYDWRNDHFIPEDPFDIVFLVPWDDLDVVEVIMELEEDLDIEIEDRDTETWAGTTLATMVDTLLAKCQPS